MTLVPVSDESPVAPKSVRDTTNGIIYAPVSGGFVLIPQVRIVAQNRIANDANYLSYGGINMEKEDRGEPTSLKVEKNPETTDRNKPQAWLMSNGKWMYNYLGSFEEATAVAKARGKTLEEVWPTELQQKAFFAAMPGDAIAKNKIMNGEKDEFTGFRHPYSGNLDRTDDLSFWWSASSEDGDIAGSVGLKCGDQDADSSWNNRNVAFPLRLLADTV